MPGIPCGLWSLKLLQRQILREAMRFMPPVCQKSSLFRKLTIPWRELVLSKARRTEHEDWTALAFQLDGVLRDAVLFGLPVRWKPHLLQGIHAKIPLLRQR